MGNYQVGTLIEGLYEAYMGTVEVCKRYVRLVWGDNWPRTVGSPDLGSKAWVKSWKPLRNDSI